MSRLLETLLPSECIQTMGGVCRRRMYLWTGSQCCHKKLHLVDEVSSLHLAPVDLLAWPSEVTPLGLLYDVTLGQLFALAAGKLDQNFAPALWSVTHWMVNGERLQLVGRLQLCQFIILGGFKYSEKHTDELTYMQPLCKQVAAVAKRGFHSDHHYWSLLISHDSLIWNVNTMNRSFLLPHWALISVKYVIIECSTGKRNSTAECVDPPPHSPFPDSPEMAYSPLGEATVTADAFPMLSTGPRPTWLLKLRTCQPITLASC